MTKKRGGRDPEREGAETQRERGGREKTREGENEREGGGKGALESFRKHRKEKGQQEEIQTAMRTGK